MELFSKKYPFRVDIIKIGVYTPIIRINEEGIELWSNLWM